MKTIKFYTLGCKVNQYDTQNIRERFVKFGFKELNNGLPADTYLVNTCTVTAVADSKSRELIRRINRENPRGRIIVTGCLVEKDASSIAGLAGVNFIIAKRFFPEVGIENFGGHTRAFLKIQDGCNNFCSYCKVPYARGPSRSRPISEIIADAGRLVKNGFKEIVLTGICLGAYGRDITPKPGIVEVIERLEELSGLLRIRLSSIEANDVSDILIKKIAVSKKLCPHLHIPLQSGDNEILKKMNRNYGRKFYLSLINKIRRIIPEIAITTDVLVGFPQETEGNFKNTINVIKEITPLKTHIFSYSERPGTAAACNFKHNLAETIVKKRVFYLKNIARDCSLAYRKQFLNRKVCVLVESRVKENPHFWQGHSDTYIKVLLNSEADLKNKLLNVRLKEFADESMIGTLNN